jgi:hypothetical protein
VLPRGDQRRGELVSHVDVLSDHGLDLSPVLPAETSFFSKVFSYVLANVRCLALKRRKKDVAFSPGPMICSVVPQDGAEGAVCGPSQQIAAILGVVAATVRVNVRLQIVHTGILPYP